MTSTTTPSAWLDFLAIEGYSISDNQNSLTTPQDDNQPHSTQLIPLTHFAAYTMIGPDGEKFLQGQTSCNISALSPTKSLLGTNCNPKGSVINFFRLMKIEDEQLLMRFPASLSEAAVANFKKYIVFSKAEFTPADERYIGMGVQGTKAETLISKITDTPPTATDEQKISDGILIIRQRGVEPRYEIWAPAEQAQALWKTLKQETSLATTNDWLLADIAAGIAVMSKNTQEEFIPQMLNLHMINAVDFHKGCYTGQEIITRLQYRGKLNKCLFRAEITTEDAPNIGDTVWSSQRQVAGDVIAVTKSAPSAYEVQMVLHINAAAGTLRLINEEGPTLNLLPLPYEVDPEWRP